MKSNVISKIILVIIMTIFIFSFLGTNVYAGKIGDIFGSASDFIQKGEESKNPTISNDNLKEMSDTIYNVLLIIGIVIAVIVGIIIGIQFITGGAEQKAKVKETLIPYVAGCAVVFGAFTIWKLVVTILQST